MAEKKAPKKNFADDIDPTHTCHSCLKWEQFGPNCHVYWDKKKICTQKVVNVDELQMEKMMR